MKIVLLTDTHAGSRGESPTFNDYFFKFYEEVFFPYLEKNDIKQVIHLGDVVERQKYTTYQIANSWRLRFWDRLRASGVKVDVLVGNHDTSNSKYSNTPNAIEELWGRYDNVRVFSEPSIQYYDSTPIALIPWINKSNHDMTMEFVQKCPAKVAMAHLELSGFAMDNSNVSKFGMDRSLFKKFEMVMSGHYHHRSTDGHIFYLGNPYEITWADYNDPRGFHIFDTETSELEFIQNPNTMFVKFTYHNGIIQDPVVPPSPEVIHGKIVRVTLKTRDKGASDFIEMVQLCQPHKLEIDDQTDVITSDAEITNVVDTMTVIEQYIDGTDNPDSDRLKSIMRELYKQANEI